MSFIFLEEEENIALQILQSIKTAHEAAGILLEQINKDNWSQFDELTGLLNQILTVVEDASNPFRQKQERIWLPITCQSARSSLHDIQNNRFFNLAKSKMKLQFEFIPILEEAYAQFYFWAYVDGHPEREKHYYEEEIYELFSNPYANSALETGKFQYEVSFEIQAYNHLDYTKKCVDYLLNSIPAGLNYELILFDNGSADETVAFFESIHPTKLVEARINWAIGNAVLRAVEGKYFFGISNDVLVQPGAIENMLDCIRSDDKTAFVVPSTPNVSNLQSIPANYANEDEMRSFAKNNNVRNPYRWEQRVRLCDPIAVRNSILTLSREGVCNDGYLSRNTNMFPDDRMSLLLRRRGYRMMLAKDSYCHHFGSVTLKDELAQETERHFYQEGRQQFYRWFGVDPWGPGFCYDIAFYDRVVGEHHGHTEVLGINCGLGGNSLKIKEQIKEYCRNTDCTLTNITDDVSYFFDLKGVSDVTEKVTGLKSLECVLKHNAYDYIVWEMPFLSQYKIKTLIELCLDNLKQGGILMMKENTQNQNYFRSNKSNCSTLSGGWFMLQNKKM